MKITSTKFLPVRVRLGGAFLVFAAAGFALSACGNKTADAEVAVATPSPSPLPRKADDAQGDLKNTDLLKIAAPCKEDEENTARVIKVDNEPVAQFCKNRKWGNPYVDASSFKCRTVAFVPMLTDDKTGVSCRNAQGVVSLATRWYPSGEGLEMCNPSEINLWMEGRDREGDHILVRCDESGMLDARSGRTKFACNDPDRAFKSTLLDQGRGVACRNDLGIHSLITADGDNFLTNSNCQTPGRWELFKARDNIVRAAKCEAAELPAPGAFLNLASRDGTFECDKGQIPKISEDGAIPTCIPIP